MAPWEVKEVTSPSTLDPKGCSAANVMNGSASLTGAGGPPRFSRAPSASDGIWSRSPPAARADRLAGAFMALAAPFPAALAGDFLAVSAFFLLAFFGSSACSAGASFLDRDFLVGLALLGRLGLLGFSRLLPAGLLRGFGVLGRGLLLGPGLLGRRRLLGRLGLLGFSRLLPAGLLRGFGVLGRGLLGPGLLGWRRLLGRGERQLHRGCRRDRWGGPLGRADLVPTGGLLGRSLGDGRHPLGGRRLAGRPHRDPLGEDPADPRHRLAADEPALVEQPRVLAVELLEGVVGEHDGTGALGDRSTKASPRPMAPAGGRDDLAVRARPASSCCALLGSRSGARRRRRRRRRSRPPGAPRRRPARPRRAGARLGVVRPSVARFEPSTTTWWAQPRSPASQPARVARCHPWAGDAVSRWPARAGRPARAGGGPRCRWPGWPTRPGSRGGA